MGVAVGPAQEAWQIFACDQEGACRAAGGISSHISVKDVAAALLPCPTLWVCTCSGLSTWHLCSCFHLTTFMLFHKQG